MKVAILAGGVGSRLSEETHERPKPMVEIGGRPLLWHIMKFYAHHGFTDFTIALGYLGDYIKRWFVDYASLTSDLTVDVRAGCVTTNQSADDDWRVHLVDTGLHTATGGRIKRLAPQLSDGTFLLTWGDGVSTVDLPALVDFHRSHGRLATLTAVRPPARFGHIQLDGPRVAQFDEKPQIGEGWVNGAFFVLEPGVFDYIDGDDMPFELDPLEHLAKDGELMAYRHHGFWQCMDTLRDRKRLEQMWQDDVAPWRVW